MPHRKYHQEKETPKEHRLLREAAHYLVFRNGNSWPEYDYLSDENMPALNDTRFDFVLASLRVKYPELSKKLSDEEILTEWEIYAKCKEDLTKLLDKKDVRGELDALQSAVQHDIHKEQDRRYALKNMARVAGMALGLGAALTASQCSRTANKSQSQDRKNAAEPDQTFADKIKDKMSSAEPQR